MKQVIYEKRKNTIRLNQVPELQPIFVKKDGKLVGMMIKERDSNGKEKWILRQGECFGISGMHDTRKQCLQSAAKYGYEFFVEEL